MLANFFIDRPIFAWVIALVILLGGGLALRSLPVTSYPAVAPPALAITLSYPGASAQVVEETAVALIEQELRHRTLAVHGFVLRTEPWHYHTNL